MNFDYLVVYRGCEKDAEAIIIRIDAIQSFELEVNDRLDSGHIVIRTNNHIYYSAQYNASGVRTVYDRLESRIRENYRVLDLD